MQVFQEKDKEKLLSLQQFTKEEIKKNATNLLSLRDEPSDPRYGAPPDKRLIKDYLRYGFIALDKPQGPTSHEVVAWVRRILGVEWAGHSGTLDPMVSGVLPVGLESATKALSALLLGPKEYVSVARIHDSVPNHIVEQVFSDFIGPIYQKPPQRSSVRRATRTREIYETELLEHKGNLFAIRVLCEAGTYVRKLVYDYGEVLQVGATMAELRRTRVCHLTEEDLTRLHDLFEAKSVLEDSKEETKLRALIRPIEEHVAFLKQITIRDSAVDSVCHGAQLAVPGVLSFTKTIKKGEIVRILSGKGELIALGESQMNEEELATSEHGIVTLTRRVIMEPSTYPKMWKKKDAESDTESLSVVRLKESILDKLDQSDEAE